MAETGAVAHGPATGWRAGLDPAAIAGTWVLFLIALPFEEGSLAMGTMIGGGLIGALVIVAGFMAASRVRSPLPRPLSAQARLMLLAVAVGAGLTAWHVGSNLILAGLDSGVRARLVERFVMRPSWGGAFAASVVEEVVFRLFLFSVLSWLAFRASGHRRMAFWGGLLASAVLFAVPHLWGRPPGGTGVVAATYEGLILVNAALAGCVLGWVFWRWGLFHAMVSHFVVDAMILLIGPLVLS